MKPRTKIVCTVGPATEAAGPLRALVEQGMDVARLNFSHADQARHQAVIERLRPLAAELGVPVAILQDLAGPKVRIGTMTGGSVELEVGRPFTLTTRPVDGSSERVSVSYPELPGEVKTGDTLLVADGAIELAVERVTREEIHCQVVVGGRLGSRKGINVPSGLHRLPILGEKDLADLRFGVHHGVDYVALSFVRSADDIRTARGHIEALGARVPIIAKIETAAALQRFEAILEAADGIMIARGDLSIETPFARVPVVQKRLIALANRAGKPVITATHMLLSMVSAPRPTRAEVADVANAIIDGSDAVMLSEETAIGAHAARAVQVMAAIAAETEAAALDDASPRDAGEPIAVGAEEAVVHAGCELATRLLAAVLVMVTRSGETARLAAKHRPPQPIVAPTGDRRTYQRLALIRGVMPLLLPGDARDLDATLAGVRDAARHHGWTGRLAVFVSHDRLWTDTL